jgi:hypothetical protein
MASKATTVGAGAPFADLHQARARLAAFAVEQHHLVARLLAHDVQVVGDGFRQVDDGAGNERLGAVKAWHGWQFDIVGAAF